MARKTFWSALTKQIVKLKGQAVILGTVYREAENPSGSYLTFNNMHISCCHGNESKFLKIVFWTCATVSAFSRFLSICLNNPRHLSKVGSLEQRSKQFYLNCIQFGFGFF